MSATEQTSARQLAPAQKPVRYVEPTRSNGSAPGADRDHDPESVQLWVDAEAFSPQPVENEPVENEPIDPRPAVHDSAEIDQAELDQAELDQALPALAEHDEAEPEHEPKETAGHPRRPALIPEPRAPREARYVVRGESRAAVDIDGGVRWERLTPQTPQHLDFFEVTYEAHAQSPCQAEMAQWLLVTSGMLDVSIGFGSYRLYPGDSVQLPPAMPCRCVNPAAEPARAVCVVLYDCVLPEETLRLPISRR